MKWSKEELAEIAKTYKTKADFREHNNTAYFAAHKMSIIDEICSHMIAQNLSRPELILKYIISQLFDNVLFNNKRIIKPYELDIFLPEFKLAFEFDGLHWHNDNDIDDIKNKLCIKKNIKLIRITDDCSRYYSYEYINNIKTQLKFHLKEINSYCKTNIQIEQIDNISDNDIIKFINDNILDYEKIKLITKSYNNYRDFKIKEKKLYRKLLKMKILDEFTNHMYKDIIYWNVELCESEINKYQTFKEFYKKSPKCYSFILRHNLDHLLNKFGYLKYKKKY